MSTNSIIGYKLENGNIFGIYCHWDGYLSYNGKILLENYNGMDKVKNLVCNGDASFIGSRINPNGNHDFENPEDDTCIFYNRDRGEKWEDVKPKEYKINDVKNFPYVYVFDGKKWLVSISGNDFVVLTKEMCKK